MAYLRLQTCRGRDTNLKKLSRSCRKLTYWSRKVGALPMRPRQVGITESRYYRWREERGALKRDELKKPKELAHEGPKGLAQGEVSAVRDNAQRELKPDPAGFEE